MIRLLKLIIALILPITLGTFPLWIEHLLQGRAYFQYLELKPTIDGFFSLIPYTHWIVTGALALYFLPPIIAAARNHNKFLAIYVLTLVAAWTQVGWVAAFIWACIGGKKAEAPSVVNQTLIIQQNESLALEEILEKGRLQKGEAQSLPPRQTPSLDNLPVAQARLLS